MKSKSFLLFIISFIQITVLIGQDLHKSDYAANKEAFSLQKDKELGEKLKAESWIQPEIPVKDLIEKLNSNDTDERIKTAMLLGKINDTVQISALEKLLLSDNSCEVKYTCVKSLKNLDSNRSIDDLINALKDSCRELKMQSAIALAYLGEKEKSFETLLQVYSNGDRREKLACNKAFRELNNSEAVNFLITAMKDSNEYVAVDAAIMLAQLEYDTEAFPVLENLLTANPNNSIKRAAMKGLAYIGDEKSLNLLVEMADYPDNLTSKRAKSFLEYFKN